MRLTLVNLIKNTAWNHFVPTIYHTTVFGYSYCYGKERFFGGQ